MTFYDAIQKICNLFNRFFWFFCKMCFGKHGKKIRISRRCTFAGIKNVYCGDDVSIGCGATFYSTRARIIIGDHVMFGPNVTIITGDHRIDIRNKPMSMVLDKEKLPSNDADVVFLGDNWVGANATILKGVTIGKGSVIAAGAVVTKNIEPYSIVAGVPAKVISRRFEE